MTFSELITAFCRKKGLPAPVDILTSTDIGMQQILYLLYEEMRELGKREWNEQKVQKTFTTIAAVDQGVITTIIGADFSSLVFATMWDNTLRRPVFGPVNDAMWANLQAFPASGPIYQFKVIGTRLHIFPAPAAGDTVYLIYQSSYPVASAAGAPKAAPSVGTDVFLLPDEVVIRGLEYRWLREKGLPWEACYIEYNDLKSRALLKTGMPNVRLDNSRFKLSPGIWVPAGDWPV